MRLRNALLPVIALLSAAASAEPPGERPIVFEARSGETVDAFRGSFAVPERRADPDSRELSLSYVRFPATGSAEGPPTVYLAGGPGGSGIGTAKGPRFPLFMAMRQFGDVIAFDQRGTGASNDMPECVSDVVVPSDRRVSDEELAGLHRDAAAECAAFWGNRGIDLLGYTTAESVADLQDLRRHLGAEKLSLWGISYGTHLALAAMKEMEGRLDRVVLASAEGLDQTVKLPARTDAYFARLQQAIDTQPEARALWPDIVPMMRRVHAFLDEAPLHMELDRPDGTQVTVVLDRPSMQRTASALIADPQRTALLLRLYRAIDRADLEFVRAVLSEYHRPDEPIDFRAMPLAMDIASGISPQRRLLVEEQANKGLVGSYLNFPMPQLGGVIEGLDLGSEFRLDPESDVPTLLLTGTLDGRTYPEGQREATRGLRNLTAVTVVHAGHNLFMVTPEVTEVIEAFMHGETVETPSIVAPLPQFAGER